MNSRTFSALSLLALVAGSLLVGCSGIGILDDLAGPLAVYQSNPSNPYRNVLIPCLRGSCSLRQLPFIGMDTTTPTTDDLMNRVVVSHEWMGRRFREAIMTLDEPARHAVLQMSRSIVAVVISAKVRPSYYNPLASIIFLDPLRLALSEEEAVVVETTPDYRSGFGSDFQFVGVWRYVMDDRQYLHAPLNADNANSAGSADNGGVQLQDVRRYLARLLFHELAHANDYYSHDVIADITCTAVIDRCDGAPWGNYIGWAADRQISRHFGSVRPSSARENDYHLHNLGMAAYAAVRYGGRDASNAQKAVRAAEIGNWLATDEANHDYAYFNNREDVAMLVEGTLVKYLFDADMDVAYINRADDGTVNGETTPVDWGIRGRIGEAAVKRRAKRVMDLMLPGLVPDSFYANLEPPRPLDSGCSWIDNLDLSCDPPTDESRTESELPQQRPTHDVWLDTLGPHER